MIHIPGHFGEHDLSRLHALVRAHSFATLVSAHQGEIQVSHLPFLLDADGRTLRAHMARANPQWQQVGAATQVLAIFAGPHGYVSPTWYPEPGVPTWNYAVVHAHGAARVVDDPDHSRRHVEALAAKFEQGRAAPWVPDYDPRRLAGIVGIEIRVDQLEGKFKLSQHRSAAERAAVVAQLTATGRDNDLDLAGLMTAMGPRS